MMITITKSNKLRAAIAYLYFPAIGTSSTSKDRNWTKIEVIAVLLYLLSLPKYDYVRARFSEESSVVKIGFQLVDLNR